MDQTFAGVFIVPSTDAFCEITPNPYTCLSGVALRKSAWLGLGRAENSKANHCSPGKGAKTTSVHLLRNQNSVSRALPACGGNPALIAP
jgi:hypothetical protein